jgi:hypothetical protein
MKLISKMYLYGVMGNDYKDIDVYKYVCICSVIYFSTFLHASGHIYIYIYRERICVYISEVRGS